MIVRYPFAGSKFSAKQFILRGGPRTHLECFTRDGVGLVITRVCTSLSIYVSSTGS